MSRLFRTYSGPESRFKHPPYVQMVIISLHDLFAYSYTIYLLLLHGTYQHKHSFIYILEGLVRQRLRNLLDILKI